MQEIKLDKQSILQRLNGCCEDLIKPQTSDVQFTLRAPLVKMQQTNKQVGKSSLETQAFPEKSR